MRCEHKILSKCYKRFLLKFLSEKKVLSSVKERVPCEKLKIAASRTVYVINIRSLHLTHKSDRAI